MKTTREETKFRENDALRERLRMMVVDPVFKEAIQLLRQRYRPQFSVVEPGQDPALALALQQSYLVGANEFPDMLELLSTPPNSVKPIPLVEWGTLHNIDNEHTSTNTTSTSNPGSDHTSGKSAGRRARKTVGQASQGQ